MRIALVLSALTVFAGCSIRPVDATEFRLAEKFCGAVSSSVAEVSKTAYWSLTNTRTVELTFWCSSDPNTMVTLRGIEGPVKLH